MDLNCKKQCIELKKELFCTKYNPPKSEDRALSSGISAATRQLKVYNPEYTIKRKEIHVFWKDQLTSLGKKYEKPQTLITFKKDVISLQEAMNNKYIKEFTRSDLKNIPAGFRIAQAQKSLSVYLKHLWCMNKIPMPPVCPIDHVVLTAIGEKGKDSCWGYINKIDEYQVRLGKIEAFVKDNKPDFTIAEWELLVF